MSLRGRGYIFIASSALAVSLAKFRDQLGGTGGVTSALESNGADKLSCTLYRIIGEESYSAGQDKRFLLTDVSS